MTDRRRPAGTGVRVGQTRMLSLASGHVAERDGDRWRVSWLPDRRLTYNQAVTAMTIAETVATTPDLHPGHRLWPHLDQWAAELHLSGPDAIAESA
jgi:hypothetical protein